MKNYALLDDISRCLNVQYYNIKNWRRLAAHFKIPGDIINELGNMSCRSPTKDLFGHLAAKCPHLTNKDVIEKLEEECIKDVKSKLETYVQGE